MGGGNPREFDFVRLYLGRDFDIHKGPLGGKFDLVAILESGEGLGMSPPSWNIPRRHLDELPAFLSISYLSLKFHNTQCFFRQILKEMFAQNLIYEKYACYLA